MEPIEKIWMKRYENEVLADIEDTVIKEYPLTIFLNGEELITLLCSPNALNYLAIGFLLSEGFAVVKEDILEIKTDETQGIIAVETRKKSELIKKLSGKRTITTGCGKGTTFYHVIDSFHSRIVKSSFEISPLEVLDLMKRFNKASELFQATGGVHSACLSDGKEIHLFHEDIGRHNAIDKIIGEAIWTGTSLNDKILITSGRISSEILIKAAKREIPMIISRSAPTNLVIQLGNELGITIIGFARGNRMNIYTAAHRVQC
ncbi:FdhD protein [Anaerosolibacter carboniphilus]|uniref:Sulfur carrier protein FdhD n=1 Tax=Anaerosolibacter carboniphilus TaxID=1417629 RepID=A0A841KP13_9FIRM|nr:formate dehydrogenase accessory sulfurtransferase FdhD [Anaerosolibacter carboniphilus]MBB6215177.1 FdhD protein [Anaerosolibacter carboniphilus]